MTKAIQAMDTLVYDSVKIAAYQADPRYNYNSQADFGNDNLIDYFFHWLDRLIRDFARLGDSRGGQWFLALFFVAVVLATVFFIYRKRPELFFRAKKMPLPVEITEENIYGVDFETELAKALDAGDYRSAVRILYLQTLRLAADREWIDWQIYKTPTEYVYELKPAALRTAFRELTKRFLQVRYGNFKATAKLYESMRRLQDSLRESGY